MKPTDLKFISTLTYLGQTYHIARNQHGYWAINAEYVDDQNRVTRELTGMECHLPFLHRLDEAAPPRPVHGEHG